MLCPGLILNRKLLYGHNSGISKHKWIGCIKDMLVSVGLSDLFLNEVIDNTIRVERYLITDSYGSRGGTY